MQRTQLQPQGTNGSSSPSSPSFASDAIFEGLKTTVPLDPSLPHKVNATFLYKIKGDGEHKGQSKLWTLSVKKGNPASVYEGEPKEGQKADVTLEIGDKDYVDLVAGKAKPQMLFMGGRLKIKGNMGMAMKLDQVLKAAKPPQAKL